MCEKVHWPKKIGFAQKAIGRTYLLDQIESWQKVSESASELIDLMERGSWIQVGRKFAQLPEKPIYLFIYLISRKEEAEWQKVCAAA